MVESNDQDREAVKFRPVERRMIEMLSDGLYHTTKELQECLYDETSKAAVRVHIHSLRKKLRPVGEDIACEMRYNKFYYRHILLLNGPTNGHPLGDG